MTGERILIVEDEENIRRTIQMALESEGYEVGTAPDGIEGLRRFQEPGGWDLVLLDQRMPGMEGVEVLHRIRTIDRSIPVILITAYGSVELAQDVLALGASGFLQKPFTPAELSSVVRRTLDGHR
jgi:CheY-like chemotaxis protein